MKKTKTYIKQVLEYFKESGYSLKETADHFNVSPPNISNIVSKHQLAKSNKMIGTYKK